MKYPQLVSMPSAVSDWLEEQLEARGIDAVVYTRYVLSLLHRDTTDLVSTDQDIQLPKSVGGRGRKRDRGSCEWLRHVRADVEQLRRAQAVDCLMSAAEQKCGIESLVDELCEKLKHFESTSTDKPESENNSGKKIERSVVSPTDLARRYYAAFPPLSCKPGHTANLISLISASNKRKHARKPNGDKLHRRTDTDNMKSRSGGKPRISYLNRKKDFGFARSMEKSDVSSDWDVYLMNGQNRAGDEGYSTSDTIGLDEDTHEEIDDGQHLANLVAKFDRRIEALWNDETCTEENQENEYHDLPVDLQELLSSPIKETAVEILNVANRRSSGDKVDRSRPFIQCGTNITSSIWSECAEEEEKSLYDSMNYCNLYNEALETSSFPDKTLGDQFNSLSMAADKINDNLFLSADKVNAENETNMLYESFSNENNDKLRFSNMKLGSLKSNEFTSLPWEYSFPIGGLNNKKWSDAENYSYVADSKFNINNNINTTAVNNSLITLNHNKEASCFKEVVPKQVLGLPAFSTLAQNQSEASTLAEVPNAKEEEDLLTSTRTHFRPIKQESLDTSSHSGHTGYADGTTFHIRSSLERVNYRRSESGTLYLESGLDSPKKYMEYRVAKDIIEEKPDMVAKDVKPDMIARDVKSDMVARDVTKDEDNESCYSIEREFVLKFCVRQNEKYCQTELEEVPEVTSHSPLEVPAKKRVLCDPEEFFFPGDEELLSDTLDNSCECNCSYTRSKLATNLEPLFNASAETCRLHGTRPDSMMGVEVSSWKKCAKCNNNWSCMLGDGVGDGVGVGDVGIWVVSSEEVCVCARPPTHTHTHCRLRQELSQDGDQLLQDLSSIHRLYMEQLPTHEVSCDLTEALSVAADAASASETAAAHVASVAAAVTVATPAAATVAAHATTAASLVNSKERKRRHSSSQRVMETEATPVARNSWSNGSCLPRAEHRPPFTPPLLRPVTL